MSAAKMGGYVITPTSASAYISATLRLVGLAQLSRNEIGNATAKDIVTMARQYAATKRRPADRPKIKAAQWFNDVIAPQLDQAASQADTEVIIYAFGEQSKRQAPQATAPEFCPLATNIQRLGAYLMAPEEVALFDWFVIKQSRIFNNGWFYYSGERIEAETRIKRRTLERVVKRFEAMTILATSIRHKPNEIGRARFFRLDFAAIVERLPEIIDKRNELFGEFRAYFKNLAKCQAKAFQMYKTTFETPTKPSS